MKYVSVAQMIAIEKEANKNGLSNEMMMENAGRGLAEIILDFYGYLEQDGVCGLVGSGNNGGDTLIALTYLAEEGWSAQAYLVRPRAENDPLVARFILSGGVVASFKNDKDFTDLKSMLSASAIVLDGVLGTGFNLPLNPELGDIFQLIKEYIHGMPDPPFIIAVDCPSGVQCDTGETAPKTIPADHTITMAAIKQGLLKFPAYNFVGELSLIDIGLPSGDQELPAWKSVQSFVPDAEWVHKAMPARPLDAHKGTFGTALIIAGSENYTGAAWLAGQAAYRIGAGLVTMGIPETIHPALAGQFPEATWLLLPEIDGFIEKGAVEIIQDHLARTTAMLVGPGFGLHPATAEFTRELFTRRSPQAIGFIHPVHNQQVEPALPALVIDADGLKLLSRIPDWKTFLPPFSILTPHPGEMSVLTGLTTEEIQKDRLSIALKFSRDWGHIVVLKGAFTIIAHPNGQGAIIPVATPALARAGTGDVLAGIIVGLRAQGVEPFTAAAAGAWIHAQAGLYASEQSGNSASVLAGDVARAINDVISQVLASG